jgi:chemotaxis protein CheD
MIFLGIGDLGVTQATGETIKTIGLGSCVAVVCFDAIKRVAGMVHIALPDSCLAKEMVEKRPGYCADTGIAVLFQNLKRAGCLMTPPHFQVKLVGGAAICDPNGTFNIGKRNILAAKKILWANGLGPIAEEVGGTISRTVSIAVDTGQLTITTPGQPARIL